MGSELGRRLALLFGRGTVDDIASVLEIEVQIPGANDSVSATRVAVRLDLVSELYIFAAARSTSGSGSQNAIVIVYCQAIDAEAMAASRRFCVLEN